MRRPASLPLLLLLAFAAIPAAAQQQPKGKKAATAEASAVRAVPPFSEREQEVIRVYFTEHRTQVKPLPPGIAKNLARGKPLPPGIAKQQIPDGLRTRLPERAGTEVLIFGDRIVVLDPVGLVVDVLNEVF